jgi:class 3 adenylate cyclase
VNVASRLEHLARAHDASIVTSAETLAAAVNSGGFAIDDSKRFRPIGAIQVPGRGEPIEVFVMPFSDVAAR